MKIEILCVQRNFQLLIDIIFLLVTSYFFIGVLIFYSGSEMSPPNFIFQEFKLRIKIEFGVTSAIENEGATPNIQAFNSSWTYI